MNRNSCSTSKVKWSLFWLAGLFHLIIPMKGRGGEMGTLVKQVHGRACRSAHPPPPFEELLGRGNMQTPWFILYHFEILQPKTIHKEGLYLLLLCEENFHDDCWLFLLDNFLQNFCSDYSPGREAGKHPCLETWHRQTLWLWVSLLSLLFFNKKETFQLFVSPQKQEDLNSWCDFKTPLAFLLPHVESSTETAFCLFSHSSLSFDSGWHSNGMWIE